MEFLELALILLGGVLLSSLLEPLLPRVSLPLVQIALGVVIALLVQLPVDIDPPDTDLFLVLFIAPLLFDESRKVSNASLWKNKGSVLSLAIGLVVVTTLVVGFTLNLVVPAVSLAAAFAVGAALGPTDAVAVASLGKDISLSARQKAQLSGEALLNDASGVVAFQFAIAGTVTGAFNAADAGMTFALEFFGGLGIGIAIGAVYLFITHRVRRFGLDNVTIHVLFELCLPFLIYLVAAHFHASGIIAVVAAGLLVTFSPYKDAALASLRKTPEASRLSLVSDSVWDVLSFALNGIIFLAMGIFLPELTQPTLEDVSTTFDFVQLAAMVLAATAVMHLLRFLWVLAIDFLSSNEETNGRFRLAAGGVRRALVTTLSGAKGAVAIAIAFTMFSLTPESSAYAERNLLMFIVCGVCVVSLLLANFIVPLLAPRSEQERDAADADAEIEILNNVIAEMSERKTKDNARALSAVIQSYQRRIAVIRRRHVSSRQLKSLRLGILERQENFIRQAMGEDVLDKRVAEDYLKRIERLKRRLKIASSSQLQEGTQSIRPLASPTSTFGKIQHGIAKERQVRSTLEFKIELESVAVRYLESVSRGTEEDRVEAAKALLAEHKPLLSALKQRKRLLDEEEGIVIGSDTAAGGTVVTRTETGRLKKVRPANKPKTPIVEVHAEALRVELEEIQLARRRGAISNATARELREDVYLIQMGLNDL